MCPSKAVQTQGCARKPPEKIILVFWLGGTIEPIYEHTLIAKCQEPQQHKGLGATNGEPLPKSNGDALVTAHWRLHTVQPC